MKKVYKYVVPIRDKFSLDLPIGSEILSFQCQYEKPCIWALIDPEAELEERRFRFAGIRHPIIDVAGEMHFIGTVQMHGGALV